MTDIVRPLLVIKNGNKYLLTFQDTFSKYPEATGTQSNSMEFHYLYNMMTLLFRKFYLMIMPQISQVCGRIRAA